MAVNRVRRNGSYAPLSAHYYKDDAIDEAGEAAELLYVRGLAFCADVLSDGFISDRQLVRFVGVGMFDAPDRAQRLVDVGLWVRGDGGYWVRSWLNWNRSRAEITEAQAKDSARKASSRGSDRPDRDPPDGGGQDRGQDTDRNPSGVRTESERTGEWTPGGVQPRAGARARTPRHSTPLHDSSTSSGASADDPDSDGLFGDPAPTPPPKPDDRFDEFWQLWPKKVKKQDAKASWNRKVTDKRVDVDLVLTALRNHIVAWQVDPRYPKFVPDPTTWLNGARWHDEIETPRFKVITNPDSPWQGTRISTSESPWAEDMGWA